MARRDTDEAMDVQEQVSRLEREVDDRLLQVEKAVRELAERFEDIVQERQTSPRRKPRNLSGLSVTAYVRITNFNGNPGDPGGNTIPLTVPPAGMTISITLAVRKAGGTYLGSLLDISDGTKDHDYGDQPDASGNVTHSLSIPWANNTLIFRGAVSNSGVVDASDDVVISTTKG
jgi:hypothetical protein